MRSGRREAESFTVRPEESNSIEQELSAVKLANGKKVVNHLRSNKNIRKTRSRTHGGDKKARPITNLDRRRTRGV